MESTMAGQLSQQLTQEDLLKLFLSVYYLPKSVHVIEGTHSDHHQVYTIDSLKQKLAPLLQKLNRNPIEELKDFTFGSYSSIQNLLKCLLVQRIYSLYPNQPSFKIINEINNKLEGRHQNKCEDLLIDLIGKQKQTTIRKEIERVIQKKFSSYDIDGSGSISFQELQDRLQNMNLPKSIATQIMDYADIEKDGTLTFKQFKEYTQKKILQYYKIFFHLDSDNDNMLSYDQTKQSITEIYPGISINSSVYEQIFKTMDQDRSGFINFEQWCEFLIVFPHKNFNMMVNQWGMFASTMIVPQQSSSFLNDDLIKSTQTKNGKRIFSYWDVLRTLIFGAIAGGVSRTITAPLERLKILYQTMYTTTKCPSIVNGLKQSVANHGVASLFKGNSISIFLNCLEQSLRFSIIEYSKKSYEVNGDKIHPHQFLFIGVITGVLSSLILFPFEVLRVRFITSDDRSVFHQMKQIYQKSGPKGFYSGLLPHLISVLPAGSFNVMSYNMLRTFFVSEKDSENPKIHKFMLIGGVAALITNTFTYPLSLVTSRLIMANKDIKMYKDKIKTHDMIKKIYSGEGFSGFYKGFRASLLRVFIGQSFNFGTYETLKSLWNLKNDMMSSRPKSKRN